MLGYLQEFKTESLHTWWQIRVQMGSSLVRKVSLCLAAESYKPCCSFDAGPWSQ